MEIDVGGADVRVLARPFGGGCLEVVGTALERVALLVAVRALRHVLNLLHAVGVLA